MYYTKKIVLLVIACTSILGVYGTERLPKIQNGTKIVGGKETTIQKHPYQVYLLLTEAGTGNKYQCGGSIVKSQCVLTAAHCLAGIELANIRVGSTEARSGGATYTSRMLTTHPKYDPITKDYDLGIIRLTNPIKIDGKNTSTITFPSKDCTVAAGTNLTVTGWGTTKENGKTTDTLMEVSVDAVSSNDCKKTYQRLTSRMICAGVPEGGKDSCQGDSGGPLVRTGTKTQVGIVSFGRGCARPDIPGVYTNLCDRDIQNWLEKMNCA